MTAVGVAEGNEVEGIHCWSAAAVAVCSGCSSRRQRPGCLCLLVGAIAAVAVVFLAEICNGSDACLLHFRFV